VAGGEDPFALMRRLVGSPYRAVPGAASQFEGVCVGVRLQETAEGRGIVLATYRGGWVPAASAPRFGGFREAVPLELPPSHRDAVPHHRPGGSG
jgi:hypothetical protein